MTTTKDRCIEFINKVRESKFITFRDMETNAFNRLMGKGDRETSVQPLANNNQSQASSNSDKWLINLSNKLLPSPRSLCYLKVQSLP